MTSARAYARELYRLGHGTALYEPESEVYVGDVGFFHEGGFFRLFNAILPADHPLQQATGVPDEFQPLEISARFWKTNTEYFGPQALHTRTVKKRETDGEIDCSTSLGAGIEFTCLNALGAILVLRRSMAREDVMDTRTVRRYIRANIYQWYAFAQEEGHILTEGDLVLIRGCDKTSSWALAAFAEKAPDANIFFKGTYIVSEGDRVALSGSWTQATAVEHRAGPGDRHQDTIRRFEEGVISPTRVPEECTQCVFLRVWKIRRRPLRLPLNIKAAAEPRTDEGDDEDNSPGPQALDNLALDEEDDAVEIEVGTKKEPHPLDSVLEYILRHSAAEIAIASDSDIVALSRISSGSGDELPDDIGDVVNNAASHVYVDEGCGSLFAPSHDICPLLFSCAFASIQTDKMPDGSVIIRINAGTTTGVRVGSVFLLYPSSGAGVPNIATVKDVNADHCIAYTAFGADLGDKTLDAWLVSLLPPLRLAVVKEASSSTVRMTEQRCVEALSASAQPIPSVCLVDGSTDADVLFEVEEDVIHVKRQGGQHQGLRLPMIRLRISDTNVFNSEVISSMARFYNYLSLRNFTQPFASKLSVRMHKLPQEVGSAKILSPGEEVPLRNGQFLVPGDDTLIYAFLLENRSDTPLYPYVLFMDSLTYSIELFYAPTPGDTAPLLPGGTLQLGRSAEYMTAVSFYCAVDGPDGPDGPESSYFKIIFSETLLDLSAMEQRSLFVFNESGMATLREPQATLHGIEALRGVWDTWEAVITVEPSQSASVIEATEVPELPPIIPRVKIMGSGRRSRRRYSESGSTNRRSGVGRIRRVKSSNVDMGAL